MEYSESLFSLNEKKCLDLATEEGRLLYRLGKLADRVEHWGAEKFAHPQRSVHRGVAKMCLEKYLKQYKQCLRELDALNKRKDSMRKKEEKKLKKERLREEGKLRRVGRPKLTDNDRKKPQRILITPNDQKYIEKIYESLQTWVNKKIEEDDRIETLKKQDKEDYNHKSLFD